MKIKRIRLTNFRGIEEVSLELSKKLNLFVGVNGSGKTTILDATVIALSWLINRIQTEGASGKPIADSSIKLSTPYSSILVEAEEERKDYQWEITNTAKGQESTFRSDYTGVSELAAHFRHEFRNTHVLPVIAYYPVNRAVGTSSPFSSMAARQSSFDVYNNAIGGKTNYQSFFEWFRIQEDIVNEEGRSYSKWLHANDKWIKSRARKLFDFLLDNKNPDDFRDGLVVEEMRERYLVKSERKIEPRYLFVDLLEAMEFAGMKNLDKISREFLREFEFILNRIANLADADSGRDLGREVFSSKRIQQILHEIDDLIERSKAQESNTSYTWTSWLWSALNLGVLLNLWWLNEASRKEIDALFRDLRPRKWTGYGTYAIKAERLIEKLQEIVNSDEERYTNAAKNPGRELHYVSKTIEQFLPGYTDLRVKRYPKPQLLVEKDGETISLDQLSDGEKNLIALVGDIARRLTIANAGTENPLKGKGIILIDEIDLHLHPGWQRLMIPQLTKVFPNCQFLITTHSPQVISHAKKEDVFLLKKEQRGFVVTKPAESFGKNTDRILEDLLGVDARPTEEKELIHQLFVMIQQGELEQAKAVISELYQRIGEDPEIVKAQALVARKEIIGK